MSNKRDLDALFDGSGPMGYRCAGLCDKTFQDEDSSCGIDGNSDESDDSAEMGEGGDIEEKEEAVETCMLLGEPAIKCIGSNATDAFRMSDEELKSYVLYCPLRPDRVSDAWEYIRRANTDIKRMTDIKTFPDTRPPSVLKGHALQLFNWRGRLWVMPCLELIYMIDFGTAAPLPVDFQDKRYLHISVGIALQTYSVDCRVFDSIPTPLRIAKPAFSRPFPDEAQRRFAEPLGRLSPVCLVVATNGLFELYHRSLERDRAQIMACEQRIAKEKQMIAFIRARSGLFDDGMDSDRPVLVFPSCRKEEDIYTCSRCGYRTNQEFLIENGLCSVCVDLPPDTRKRRRTKDR